MYICTNTYSGLGSNTHEAALEAGTATNSPMTSLPVGPDYRSGSISDEPIIIERNRGTVAVPISLKTFRERFIDYREEQKRRDLQETFRASAVRPGQISSPR